MKRIPLRQAQVKWLAAMRRADLVSITLWTFKKDRWVKLEQTGGEWVLTESGFVNSQTTLVTASAKKALKEPFAREFPRSTQLYIQET